MRRLAVAAAVAAAVFALWVSLGTRRGDTPPLRSPSEAGVSPDGAMSPDGNGPEIVLREVAMREIREDGEAYRLRSDEASYSPGDETLSASAMTLEILSGPSGGIVVRAGSAAWDLAAGRIVLPEGGSAESAQGWTAQVPEGSLDLRERVFRGAEATLSGPGVAMAGRDLVWRWEDGSVTLLSPRSRIVPEGLPPPGGMSP